MAYGGESSSEGNDQFTQLLAAFQLTQERIDCRFTEFLYEVWQGQEEAAAKALKCVRREKPYTFQRKGNEEQAAFNDKVDETIAEAQAELKQDSGSTPALQRAHDTLATGRKLLAEHQKLIRMIADRSEYGWGVVAEYTADELADDSDDEKCLEKAEKAAERKAVKRKKKGGESSRTGKGRYNPAQAAPAPSVSAPTTASTYPAKRPVVAPAPARAIGPCFACGEMGHIRSYCPKTAPENRKWYPLHSCASGVELLPASSKEPGDPVVHDATIADWSGVELGSVGCCWEIEAAEQLESGELNPASPILVKGRLKLHIQFWKGELGAPAWVLSTIKEGYVLPLKSEPTPNSRQNQASAMLNQEFVQQCVADLLMGGCIKEVSDVPYICSPLSVVESSGGKKRLVINLRHLNQFLWKQKFKYEDFE